MRYFDKAFTDESVNTTKQTVPRSRVQSDYFGFTYNASNPIQNELGNYEPEFDENKENKNDSEEP